MKDDIISLAGMILTAAVIVSLAYFLTSCVADYNRQYNDLSLACIKQNGTRLNQYSICISEDKNASH